jgi:hypothetical protein
MSEKFEHYELVVRGEHVADLSLDEVNRLWTVCDAQLKTAGIPKRERGSSVMLTAVPYPDLPHIA